MNAQGRAIQFLQQLPADEEGPERATSFQELILRSRTSQPDREIARAVYQLAASGDWAPGLADVSMLIYALPQNPGLIRQVRHDVERVLARNQVSGSLLTSWRWVQGQASRIRDLGSVRKTTSTD